MISWNCACIWSGSGMMSTVPSRAWAIRRISSTCQSVPAPRQSHWKTPVALADRGVELGGALAVLAVGEQDGVPLGDLGHRREEGAGQLEPGADRGAAAADEGADRLRGLAAGARVHLHHPGTRRDLRVGQHRAVRARDDREPGAVEDLGQRGLGRLLGGRHRLRAHRARGVDDDDLAGRAAAGLAGRAGAGARDRHDRVDVGAAVGKELVLVDGGGELSHRTPSSPLGRRVLHRHSARRSGPGRR